MQHRHPYPGDHRLTYAARARPPARPLRALFVASEYFPLAKTGGLADVVGALPEALTRLGAEARVIIPGYPSALEQLHRDRQCMKLEVLGRRVQIIKTRLPGSSVQIYLVCNAELFERPGSPYVDPRGQDWADNALRFAVFNHAAARLATGRTGSSWRPDVVHCHDWQAGLTPLLIRFSREPRPATLFTIHNAAFAGRFSFDTVRPLQIPEAAKGIDGAEFYGDFSFLKAGIFYADKLTTVSPTYARELCTAEYGCGFDGLLRARAGDLVGILNGIDAELWNPAKDPYLVRNYSRTDCGGKQACKADLQEEFGLQADPDAPLAIFASRITAQKMADVVLTELSSTLQSKPALQFALLGRGDIVLENGFRELAQAFPGRASARLDYSESLAHRLQAGGDILLHGSRFEPCGLVQMYAMRYGTVPLVRNVGGLADSVTDADARGLANGFVFEEATGEAMFSTLNRCVDTFAADRGRWRELQRVGMTQDFSWSSSAKKYLRLYGDSVGSGPLAAREQRLH